MILSLPPSVPKTLAESILSSTGDINTIQQLLVGAVVAGSLSVFALMSAARVVGDDETVGVWLADATMKLFRVACTCR